MSSENNTATTQATQATQAPPPPPPGPPRQEVLFHAMTALQEQTKSQALILKRNEEIIQNLQKELENQKKRKRSSKGKEKETDEDEDEEEDDEEDEETQSNRASSSKASSSSSSRPTLYVSPLVSPPRKLPKLISHAMNDELVSTFYCSSHPDPQQAVDKWLMYQPLNDTYVKMIDRRVARIEPLYRVSLTDQRQSAALGLACKMEQILSQYNATFNQNVIRLQAQQPQQQPTRPILKQHWYPYLLQSRSVLMTSVPNRPKSVFATDVVNMDDCEPNAPALRLRHAVTTEQKVLKMFQSALGICEELWQPVIRMLDPGETCFFTAPPSPPTATAAAAPLLQASSSSSSSSDNNGNGDCGRMVNATLTSADGANDNSSGITTAATTSTFDQSNVGGASSSSSSSNSTSTGSSTTTNNGPSPSSSSSASPTTTTTATTATTTTTAAATTTTTTAAATTDATAATAGTSTLTEDQKLQQKHVWEVKQRVMTRTSGELRSKCNVLFELSFPRRNAVSPRFIGGILNSDPFIIVGVFCSTNVLDE